MLRTFSVQRHEQFAALSGDFNPIHMDAVAARRTQAGAPVVHGVHALLELLDEVAVSQAGQPLPRTIKASFRKMIYVGDRAEPLIAQNPAQTAKSLRAQLLVDRVEVVSAVLNFGTTSRALPAPTISGGAAVALPSSPVDLALEDMAGLSGQFHFATPAQQLAAMFPNAVRHFGATRIGALAASSSLVGMVVPGLQSLFAELTVALDEQLGEEALRYQVTSVDPRFRLVKIAIAGGGVTGAVSAISRPPPIAQPDMKAIAALVGRNEFAGAVALVIGGSRGIGEVTAKLLAAGGARVYLTFRDGRSDAERVVQEIRNWGGEGTPVGYDARESAAPQLQALPEPPSHAYYFATPTIYRRKTGVFDPNRFQEFNAYYVSGFMDLAQACLHLRPAGVRLFYPSTVYVESRPDEMTEYAMSKAAGEVLCQDLSKQLRGVDVVVRRLPRVATDQTVSVIPISSASASDTMLPIVRDVQRSSSS